MTATPCVAAIRRDGQTQPCPDPVGSTPLCDAHLSSATRAVALLVHDYRDLEQELPRPMGQWGDGQPGHCAEAPIPLRLDVEELQRRIWHLSTTWAEVLADRHRLSDQPVRVRDGFAVSWAVSILGPRCEKLARLESVQMVNYPVGNFEATNRTIALSYVTGAQGLLDLSHAHQHARSILGLTEPVYELPGHCQNRGCGRPELRVKDGSDTVWCDRCGSQMTRDDYDRYGNLFLREAA